MATDDHHDNRYEDGEPLPTTDWDFDPEDINLPALIDAWDNRDKTEPF